MKLLEAYALSFLGLPYIWGGDDTVKGFDCSGLVQEILSSIGLDPAGDQTAQSLHDHFAAIPHTKEMKIGTLYFYGKDTQHITHVAFGLDHMRMIEAGGGGSKTLTSEDAARQNAFIRMRPILARKDLVAQIRPIYPEDIV